MGSDQLVHRLIGRESEEASDAHSRRYEPFKKEIAAFPKVPVIRWNQRGGFVGSRSSRSHVLAMPAAGPGRGRFAPNLGLLPPTVRRGARRPYQREAPATPADRTGVL